jgi:hypothetical protein
MEPTQPWSHPPVPLQAQLVEAAATILLQRLLTRQIKYAACPCRLIQANIQLDPNVIADLELQPVFLMRMEIWKLEVKPGEKKRWWS